MCVCVCVWVCDLETSTVRRPGPHLGCCATEKMADLQLQSAMYLARGAYVLRINIRYSIAKTSTRKCYQCWKVRRASGRVISHSDKTVRASDKRMLLKKYVRCQYFCK
jgi:hypothetical protein